MLNPFPGKFCDTADDCIFIIEDGMTTSQRMELLSGDPDLWEKFNQKACSQACEDKQKSIEASLETLDNIFDNIAEQRLKRNSNNQTLRGERSKKRKKNRYNKKKFKGRFILNKTHYEKARLVINCKSSLPI